MKNDILFFNLLFLLCIFQLFCQDESKYELLEINAILEKKEKNDLEELKNLVETFVELDSLEQRGFDRVSLFSKDEYYPFLKRYTDTLWPELFKHYKTNIYFREALGLINPPDSIKESLINYEHTETHIKAALGDSSSETRIIEKFNSIVELNLSNDSLSRAFVKLKKQLLYINSETTLSSFFKEMGSEKTYFPEYDSNLRNKLHWSFFESFRLTYSKVYKYEGIVSPLHRSKFIGLKSRTAEIKSYFREIENYIQKKHGFKMNIKAPFVSYGERNIIEDQLVIDPDNN